MRENDLKTELSIVMPCLNEANTLALCINRAASFLKKNGISGEIIIADNGSIDGSQAIALANGANVVNVKSRGYGSALTGGIQAAKGKYVVIGDADNSYDFMDLSAYVDKLREGYDLVMGNRFAGGIKKGAMPFLHQYLGNPVLSALGRIFFGNSVKDFHCGLRAFRKSAIDMLNLQTTGMEFASEMVVKATLFKLKIAEVPTILYPDGRNRRPHLNTWRDGWRHLRFLLLYSPRWLFLYPGIVLFLLGFVVLLMLSISPITIMGVTFDIHTMVYASVLTVLGLQALFFAIFTKLFTVTANLIPFDDKIVNNLAKYTLEKGLIVGCSLILAGVLGSMYALFSWKGISFGGLVPSSMMRIVIPSATAIIIGAQVILAGFFISILRLIKR